jgi:RHS repeat-associated protein
MGLDYFGARYFASTQGRFTSPDPLLASGRTWAPQSWNRYSYVLNNPLRLIDPTGLVDDDPQDKLQHELLHQQPPPPPFKVKVDIPPSQVFTNEKLPDGTYLTGVGSKITVTLTDANDKPIAGASVTESNKAVPGQPGAPTEGGREALSKMNRR